MKDRGVPPDKRRWCEHETARRCAEERTINGADGQFPLRRDGLRRYALNDHFEDKEVFVRGRPGNYAAGKVAVINENAFTRSNRSDEAALVRIEENGQVLPRRLDDLKRGVDAGSIDLRGD